ncbi:nucleotidyl transferase AbiEii/AbiGii toxin family protein [Modestobacter sp. DSM 44400]|uniref:nucleotidyl transferase AbiEii/AbiGii toxin family protein n=1 Tax=Modestobacter sp. DSM 44400 TaxID=1550230 RepID=UPI00352B6D7C
MGIPLGGQIELLGYPLPMVLAEKVVTAAQRGTASTRGRDLANTYLLTAFHCDRRAHPGRRRRARSRRPGSSRRRRAHASAGPL